MLDWGSSRGHFPLLILDNILAFLPSILYINLRIILRDN